ncbi:MAG: polysaccharide pyruvyl transferase family protein [Pseudomonadota bacterium]
MKSIFFHSTPFSIAKSKSAAQNVNGCVFPALSRIDEMRPSFNQTGNRGNMVHAEAPQKLFRHNLSLSCTGNLVSVQQADPFAFSDYINSFDVIILSVANLIRKNQDHSRLVAALKEIHKPLFVFSAGLQTRLDSLSHLSPSTRDLLSILNEKAALFSVRGETTQEFLHTNGINNCVALGCPSLYVYPDNIRKIAPMSLEPFTRLTVAGHFSRENLSEATSKSKRAVDFYNFMSSCNNPIDYVLQDEIFTFSELLNEKGMFDDATFSFDTARMTAYFASLNVDMKFVGGWYMFDNVSAWRSYIRSRDLYFGDRFHGGVVALQTGTPAIIVKGDARVMELVDYFKLPSATFADMRTKSLAEIVERELSSSKLEVFHKCYTARRANFVKVCKKAGLSFAEL